jgi:hypothetical protein
VEKEMNGNLAINDDSNPDELNFRKALITLSAAFARKGYKVKPFTDRAWRDFVSFPAEKKKKIIQDFSHYSALYLPVLQQEGSPNEDGRLIWAAVKKLGLRPCSDFFDQVEESDVVEFYSRQNLQIFHNINFFELCSYSFLEIFAYPFTELWKREAGALEETKQAAIDCFNGKFSRTVDANFPKHYLVEAFSEEAYLIEMQFRKFAPLFDEEGAIAAIAAVSRGRLLSEPEYRKIMADRPGIPEPLKSSVLEVAFNKS